MKRISFDRVFVRSGPRTIGPLTARFGPGMHGLAFARLDDLETLESSLTGEGPVHEGRVHFETDEGRLGLVHLRDLLPLPPGYTLGRFARLIAGGREDVVIARCALGEHRRTNELGPIEALSFATALFAEIAEVGAVLVPAPSTFLPATFEREGAKILRRLASSGLPVVVLLPPGIRAERFVDDVVAFDDSGTARESTGVHGVRRDQHGLVVRGVGLAPLARGLVRQGLIVGLDDGGRELTVHASRVEEAERALTEALASHDGPIDEVRPCP